MPKKATQVGMDAKSRRRISVELCPDSTFALEQMYAAFEKWHGQCGLSPIIRAALLEVYRSGAWEKMTISTLTAAKHKDELRKVTRQEPPPNSFPND